MRWLVISCALVLAACGSSNDKTDGGVQDGGSAKTEASTTDVCHRQRAMCAWTGTGMCETMTNGAVGGGAYSVEKIELTTEDAAPYYKPDGEKRPRTVAYITMALKAYIWGKRVDGFVGRLALNDDCNLGVEDESYYNVGDEMILSLYPDQDTGTYKVFGWCMQKYTFVDGKASYGCIGLWNGLTVTEIQAIFEKAKKPDGTYDCTIPEGQCDYWLNPKDGGT